jgi:hypothetical protein
MPYKTGYNAGKQLAFHINPSSRLVLKIEHKIRKEASNINAGGFFMFQIHVGLVFVVL